MKEIKWQQTNTLADSECLFRTEKNEFLIFFKRKESRGLNRIKRIKTVERKRSSLFVQVCLEKSGKNQAKSELLSDDDSRNKDDMEILLGVKEERVDHSQWSILIMGQERNRRNVDLQDSLPPSFHCKIPSLLDVTG